MISMRPFRDWQGKEAGEMLPSTWKVAKNRRRRLVNRAVVRQTGQCADRARQHTTRASAGRGRKLTSKKERVRARQGSIRTPPAGGGVIFGPKPRSYACQ